MHLNKSLVALLLTIPAICSAQTTISPGLWQIGVQLNTEAVAMPPVTANQCLTYADAKDPSKLLGGIANPGASSCAYTSRNYSGSTFSFSMTCGGTLGITATGNVSFTATPGFRRRMHILMIERNIDCPGALCDCRSKTGVVRCHDQLRICRVQILDGVRQLLTVVSI